MKSFRHVRSAGSWDGVEILTYKDDGTAPFKDVTRQVLFADPNLGCEWRYFEVGAGGHSTLERHEHVHAVMVHRGHGTCMVGHEVRAIAVGDLVFIPSMTWHQFRASGTEPLGFLCLVNAERDKPQLPDDAQLAEMMSVPTIRAFLAGA